MCVTCGCSEESSATLTASQGQLEQNELHAHSHVLPDGTVIYHAHVHGAHGHSHLRGQGDTWTDGNFSATESSIALSTHHPAPALTYAAQNHSHTITLEQNILAQNDQIAAHNRAHFQSAHILALNLVSSPGAGKTTLLTRTIQDLRGEIPITVMEGDQATSHDSDRIRAVGCPVIQVNTDTGCHLEAAMVQHGLEILNPAPHSILMIENVGNLVCPALFDLGETAKVTVLSVTEGDDKPIKYPHMFRASQVMVLNKTDLLPYVQFDVETCLAYARQVNPSLQVFQLSAVTGEGLPAWYDWLQQQIVVTCQPS